MASGGEARPLGTTLEVANPRDVVAEIGELYLSAPSTPRDAWVVAAYGQLAAQTDRLFRTLFGGEEPRAVRLVFTRCREPYASDRELIAAVRACHVLEMTTVAINRERIHPVLGCEYGGAFDRFRAVHDLIGHAETGFGFALHEEIAAWRLQDRLHSRLARRALASELLGVNSARSITGAAPVQKAMLLPVELVDAARDQRDSASTRMVRISAVSTCSLRSAIALSSASSDVVR